MAWWQKKLLQYGLLRSGLFEDGALNLDDLNITWGRRSVVELKEVALDAKQIGKFARLPPSLRVESARVLSLRITIPANLYQSGVEVEVDGIELTVKLLHEIDGHGKRGSVATPSPTTTRFPQHRKVHRRLRSPAPRHPYEPGENVHVPTAEELAKSFLLEEPTHDKRALEASLAADSRNLEQSTISDSSNADDVGTGAQINVPGFLAGFLQGVTDKVQMNVKNVSVKVETELSGDVQEPVPVTVRLRVGTVSLRSIGLTAAASDHHHGKRNIEINNVSIDLLSDATTFSQLSEVQSHSSPANSKRGSQKSPTLATTATGSPQSPGLSGSTNQATVPGPDEVSAMFENSATAAGLVEGSGVRDKNSLGTTDYDIKPGDDNVSWGSRRSKTSGPIEDLWSSMASEDDLPDSLLLDRTSTPRPQESRSESPVISRSRRAVSPYDRTFRSPGSWPRFDESPEGRRPYQNPDSWPILDANPRIVHQPLTPGPALELEDPMDNKRTALFASVTDGEADLAESLLTTQTLERDDSPLDEMAQSRFYSHEEAESLYMSAMTHGTQPRVPGGWQTEGPSSDHSRSSEHEETLQHEPSLDRRPPPLGPVAVSRERAESGNATPRAQSPLSRGRKVRDEDLVLKQLLHIDQASLWLPSSTSEHEDPLSTTSTYRQADTTPASTGRRDMPGTFSLYSERAASRHEEQRVPLRNTEGTAIASQPVATASGVCADLEIQLGRAVVAVDLSCCRLVQRVVSAALVSSSESVDTFPEAQGKQQGAGNEDSLPPGSTPPISIGVRSLRVSLMEQMAGGDTHLQDVGLVALECTDTSLTRIPGNVRVRVGGLRGWISGSELLAFDRQSTLGDSTLLTEATPDIAIRYSDNKVTVQNRPVHELVFEVLPVKLDLDLGALDDTLGSFGGLSGVLELSNSFSEGGASRSPTTAHRTSKGVRFAGEKPEVIKAGAELKITGRIAGADITLRGETCAINLRSSTIKAVVRDSGASVTIGHVVFAGPRSHTHPDGSISAGLATLRLDYLLTPKDTDLERLLSLLTPSKDKYENDEDILIDTLLRQRRKGALARVCLDDFKIKINDMECFSELATLGAELSKLSAVTKYLPEDERPGLLSLVRIKNAEARVPINHSFGNLELAMQEVHCAHVGLPALLALSVDCIKATRLGYGDLIHSLIPSSAGNVLPMLMARTLGNEADPIVKVKIFNTCFEYSVPTIVALTGSSATDAEDFAADLAQSIADIAVTRVFSNKGSPTGETSRSPPKRTHLDLLIHDSALGLTPEKHSAKGLLVLTDASFATQILPESTMKASLVLRKGAIFLTDTSDDGAGQRATANPDASSNTTASARLSNVLTQQGYASVGSLLFAKITTAIDDTGASKSVAVDISNELLLLETCADSTQSLFAVLGGLAPPSSPSKRPKYLTEPMTIEDMMASFTGEPVLKPSAPPETLFDVEEESDEDPGTLLDASTLGGRADNLLLESEMTESLYGPMSGMLGGVDRPDEDELDENEFPETVESLLEDDPFEMPLSPTELGLSDSALTRDLARQCRTASKEQAVDLGLYEIEDLVLDALGAGVLGTRHRFNTPTSKRRKLPQGISKDKLPFRLRLRDTHLIWNLYDGYDWQRTRDGITHGVEQVEARAEERKARRRRSHHAEDDEESVIGDFLFNSIYVGVAATHDAQELRRQINRGINDLASETESVPVSGMSRPTAYSASGRPLRQHQRRRLKLERSKAHKIAFELKGVSADLLVYPPEAKDTVSDLDMRVRDIDIFDNVTTSTWRKFLTCLDDGTRLREMSKPMVHVEVNTVRTLHDLAASELIIHASVLPLRLHVDQDALDFIVRFFEFKDDRVSTSADPTEQPFIQRLEVDTVDLCLDYKPKRIDYGGLRSGHTNELMNMITLDAANIRLQHAIIYGIKGFEPLHKTLNDIWMPDVKRNQLPTVLAGLAPVRGLVNIGSGVRDVIAIPIREYRKDGRIVRSIQKGAMHFGRTTTSELARFGAKLAIGTQNILQGAEDLLSPPSASASGSRPGMERRVSSAEQAWHDIETGGVEEDEHEHRAISAYANQPVGVLSGLRSARLHLEHDLLTARDALIAVQGELLESESPGAAAAAVARYAPTVILRPVIGATRAVGTTLLGVGNQIDRQNMRRMDDKYKRR
ncbi:autophagy-related protein 2 [Friedmanniomyces endolithicus]|uniref:Autophagy-related protein 2 n=1 Tax=Rachicladosporium monterosium TaxID=1507873 RepID=A0ABR0L640_9PEZI|nr:autophagy-related protein 2 [Friedmanniomyces endolithicus]KAK5144079.1 autophagy-related protein 2 [Rachicladosporium monterosium]